MNQIKILLLSFVLNILGLNAQMISSSRNAFDVSVIDSGYIRVSYAFNAVDIRNTDTYDDLQLLEIGKSQSKYYSFFVYNSDSLITILKKNNPNASGYPMRMGPHSKNPLWSEYYYSEYYKDFDKNILTEYSRMPPPLRKANAYCIESIPLMNWEIQLDTLTIINYLCQKATCNFRGREFIAWFTTDIPVSNGPWKFGGLPGLILRVSDKREKYIFECIMIEQTKQPFLIKRHNEYMSYQKLSREKLLKFQKDINEDYSKVANLIPVWGGKRSPKKKYEPIELE